MTEEKNREEKWPHEQKWLQVELDELGHLPKHTHLFEAREVWAIKAAIGARRPLLVRGEPGAGKSELARAAAEVMHRPLVSQAFSSRTEPSDLHFRFDAVARLGQAQLLSAGSGGQNMASLDERRFLVPGPLWWIFDWTLAEQQYAAATVNAARPQPPKAAWGWTPQQGTVLLIDEIDTADPDLPNGLLESLGNGEFGVPYLNQQVRCSQKNEPPLIIVTANLERELPAAFVRRCLVLHLALPDGADALKPWLIQRGKAHFGASVESKIYDRAAQLLVNERRAIGREQPVRPGLAEYLDLLRAVCDVTHGNHELQDGVLKELWGYALCKHLEP